MKNKKIWAIAVLLMTVVGVAFVFANDNRRVAVIPEAGRYNQLGSSLYMDLTWSDVRGTRGTFNMRDRNNRAQNWARGTYTVRDGEITLTFTAAGGSLQPLNGQTRWFNVDNRNTLSGGGERWVRE